ncbi:unnamed protein product [Microthlaspi erraticum]|uniref:Uncharacterized protein n=1 Tax=Microthlaspi erraticum TaxID=1685480 RepID=A0A6D2JH14_9BRAS|nr:unnamed protein product [Microthlaspi erraticum]
MFVTCIDIVLIVLKLLSSTNFIPFKIWSSFVFQHFKIWNLALIPCEPSRSPSFSSTKRSSSMSLTMDREPTWARSPSSSEAKAEEEQP